VVLDNGVKETNYDTDNYTDDVKEVIREGVKKTLSGLHIPGAEMDVNHIIENGVKITAPLESREYTGDIDEVLGNGVKTSHPRQYVGEDIVNKVIDKGVIETHREICEYKHTVEHIIQTGVKETHDDVYHHKGRIEGVIKNGVKETKTPGNGNGDTVSSFEWLDENNTRNVPKMIDDIIENGVKINGTYAGGQRQSEKCKSVVEYGKQI
jgi:predicted peroxiredoxin